MLGDWQAVALWPEDTQPVKDILISVIFLCRSVHFSRFGRLLAQLKDKEKFRSPHSLRFLSFTSLGRKIPFIKLRLMQTGE